MNGALGDICVIELASVKTQFTGKLLADMGAEVILVEPPTGSEARAIGPFYEDRPDTNTSLNFWYYNTNKRSVVLDYTTADGRAILERLLPDADVLLHSLTAKELRDAGIDTAPIAKKYPALIISAVTSFGLEGPWADWQATDAVHLALGGQMTMNGYDNIPGSPPLAGGGGQSWHMGGVWGAISTVMALVERDKSSLGQFSDVSIHDAASICTELAFSYYEGTGEVVRRQTGRHALPHITSPSQLRCSDGRYLDISLRNVGPDRWMSFIEWLDSEEMAEDLTEDRFYVPEILDQEMGHVQDVVARFCLTHTADEMMQKAQALGFPWCKVFAPEELPTNEHLLARDFYVDVDHPELERTIRYPGAPYVFSETPFAIRHRAPLLGEHTIVVLHDELGIEMSDLSVLAESRVI